MPHNIKLFQSHVPEPFSANGEGQNVKEGLQEGLSGMGGQQRWSMNDRMTHK